MSRNRPQGTKSPERLVLSWKTLRIPQLHVKWSFDDVLIFRCVPLLENDQNKIWYGELFYPKSHTLAGSVSELSHTGEIFLTPNGAIRWYSREPIETSFVKDSLRKPCMYVCIARESGRAQRLTRPKCAILGKISRHIKTFFGRFQREERKLFYQFLRVSLRGSARLAILKKKNRRQI